MPEHDDAANLVVFILSDISSYITGRVMNVTGAEVVWESMEMFI
jgi:enoyl-[acyl-carrier-protein] reductase (NADH)